MNDGTSLSKAELITLVAEKDAAIATRDHEIATREQEIRTLDIELQETKLELAKIKEESAGWEKAYQDLLQKCFRNRSERYIDNPDQLRLDFGDTDDAADAAEGLADALEDQYETVPEHQRRKPRKKRDERFPEHFPRRTEIVELSEAEKTCDEHGERKLLPETMWDRNEKMVFEPPKAYIEERIYPKAVCPGHSECGIASPERPTGLVEGDKYDTSVAAQIITGKYGYHLPLYRQQDYFGSIGWTPSRSTLYNILSQAHFVLEPLLEYFKRYLQTNARVVGTDDTTVTLLVPKVLPEFDLKDLKQRRAHEVLSKAMDERKPSVKAKMWAYRGVGVKLNVFDFTVSRHRDGPDLFFADYEGTLIGDCWWGYQSIVDLSNGSIVRAACNAHARRKIVDSSSYPEDRRRWLLWYQELFDIEDEAKDMSPEARLELRRSKARPVFDAMQSWMGEAESRVRDCIVPKSDFGKALQYIRNHWEPLTRYIDDPEVPIDNNETEQLMKQVAIGRKNWLFQGSIAGGEKAAGLITLVSSALRNDLDVWYYVKDVLGQLLEGETNYESLLPWKWAESHPDRIRHYRVRERKARHERKREKRAARRSRRSREGP